MLSNKLSEPALESNASETASQSTAGAGGDVIVIDPDDVDDYRASDSDPHTKKRDEDSADEDSLAALFSSPAAHRH